MFKNFHAGMRNCFSAKKIKHVAGHVSLTALLFANAAFATPGTTSLYPISATDLSLSGYHAFSLQSTDIDYPKLHPIKTITLQDLNSQAAIDQAVSEAIAATNSQALGMKALINLDLDFLEMSHQAVVAKTGAESLVVLTDSGKELPDQGIWLDEGSAKVKSVVDAFFKKYKEQKGEVDLVALNYRGIQLSAQDIKLAGEQSGSLEEYLGKIESDSRFAEVATQLGFTNLAEMYATNEAAKQLKWDAVMKDRVAGYLNESFYQPIVSYFPNVSVSANNYYNQNHSFPLPESGYAFTDGETVGTHQSRELGGEVEQAEIMVGDTSYPLNDTNTFRRDVDRVRAMALGSVFEIHPVIDAKQQSTDYYQEFLFHAGLTGIDQFLLNNEEGTDSDNKIVNETFEELDVVIGNNSFQSSVDALLDWQTPYVLSVGLSQNKWIWRLTKTDEEFTIDSESPAKISIANQRITFPSSSIVNQGKTVSDLGVWIEQDAQSTADGCSDPEVLNDCLAYFNTASSVVAPLMTIESSINKLQNLATKQTLFKKDWGESGTGTATGLDGFSLHYSVNHDLNGGDYRFSLTHDDAARLWINGELAIDHWGDQAQASRVTEKLLTLPEGETQIRLEYADLSAEAAVQLDIQQLSCSASESVCVSVLSASVANSDDLAFIENTDGISFDAANFVSPEGLIASDALTMRWEGSYLFEDGSYVFNIDYGKGQVSVWIDDEQVFDENSTRTDNNQKIIQRMTAGNHLIRVEQAIVSGAKLDVSWEKSENSCSVLPEDTFCAEFFNGIALQGEPIHKRIDEKINFYWGGSSPEPGIVPTNLFSARWQGEFNLEAGSYRFISSTDDGIRVWVDEEEIISSWKNQGTTEYYSDLDLAAGKHLIKVEYYENYGSATATLRWEKSNDCSGIPDGQFCASYFNQKQGFEGEPDRTNLESEINLDLKSREKPLHSIRDYHYSVRWIGKFDFPETGKYQFNVDADDGMRIWIDDELVSDTWRRQWPYYKDQRIVPVSKGEHTVKVEYYQSGGEAKAKVNWEYLEECSHGVKDAFCMELFPSRDLHKLENEKAFPRYLKKVEKINNDWKSNAPAELIWKDNFSARWTGQHFFEAGNYRFQTSTDDGVKLFVDEKLLIDKWRYQRESKNQVIVPLEEGYHHIKLEYFEGGANAAAHLNWNKIASCEEAKPGQVCGTFFNTNNLTGSVADIQMTDKIDFDWGDASPTDQVNSNRFSTRWVAVDNFEKGLYRFLTDVDDGLRINVDGEMVLDIWTRKWPHYGKRQVLVPLSAGQHKIEVEYRENWGSAKAKVFWEKAPDCSVVPSEEFCTEIFDNRELSGSAIDTMMSSAINFDWTNKAPTIGVYKDRFTTRSVGKFAFNDAYYNFNASVDDGMRVWINDQLVIDNWKRNWYWKGKDNRAVKIAAGTHTVKVETIEHYGNANAKLTWAEISDCATTPENVFCMEMYEGKKLDNNGQILAKYVSQTQNIDFTWEYGAPDTFMPRDNFSVRWRGKHKFEAGDYRFNLTTDDGVRLWIDDEIVYDQWRYRGSAPQEIIIPLTAGFHDIKMEYYEGGGYAKAKLSWEKLLSCSDVPAGQFCAEFFNNKDFSGVPVDVMFVEEIQNDWKYDSPSPYVNRDNFTVRWTGNMTFKDAHYRFRTEDVDDGMRILVDDEVIIDVWNRKWPWYGDQRKLKTMTAGMHKVTVEYRENWGRAVAKAFWEEAPDCANNVPQGQFCASFYSGKDLDKSKLVDTLLESEINHNWGGGSPIPNVSRDNFSTRWVGDFDLAEGEYTFNISTDDGFKLLVDGTPILESWKYQGANPHSKRIFLEGGIRRIVVEYFEAGGNAVAKANWKAEQLGKPASPKDLKVTANSEAGVTLSWTPHALITSYNVYRDNVLLKSVTSGGYQDSHVTVATAYNYKVTAVWPNGKESDANQLSVTVADTIAPSQPTGVAALSTTATSISIGWNTSSDNVAVVSYEVWRDQKKIADVASPTYVDSQLSSFGQYQYQIIAVDASANRSQPSASVTMISGDGTAPTAPTNLVATAQSEGSIKLNWTPSADNVGVSKYQITRNGQPLGESTSSAYVDMTTQENVTYAYSVIARDNAGNESASSASITVLSGDNTAPSAVTNLRSDTDGNDVELSWDAAIDNVGVSMYRIMRDGRLLAQTKFTKYVDTSAQQGVTYVYTVKAQDSSANLSLASNAVTSGVGGLCEADQQYYVENVEPSMNVCSSCHTAGQIAQNTQFVLTTGQDATTRNMNVLGTLNDSLGTSIILNKMSGQTAHGGGTQIAVDSVEYQQIATMLDRFNHPKNCKNEDTGSGAESSIQVASLVHNCASCHGTEGSSRGPATPTISGFGQQYLYKTMIDYKEGRRASTVMQRIAKGYTDAQLQEVAAYFATQLHTVGEQVVDDSLVSLGQTIHQENCSTCHSNGGRDLASTGTRLAGQWKTYLHQTLKDYVTGQSTAPQSMLNALTTVQQNQGENGIEALAEYYASIDADTAAPDVVDGVDVAATTIDSVTLTWMDSDDDWNISYYEIYRDGVLVGTTSFNAFTDSGLMPGDYEYTIIAVDAAGNRSEITQAITASLTTDDVTPEGIELLDFSSTLRKAAILLLGRVPTEEELAKATTEESFRETLRSMMQEEKALDKFVYRAAHETFLSNGAARAGSGEGIREEDYPMLGQLSSAERRLVNNSIQKEPVYLLQHIVDKDRPWTESLTADYTVLNGALAKTLGATPISGSFADLLDSEERLPSRIARLSARLGDKAFPHAGVLTTNAWLSRFPTTDTNRNRHRSAMVFKQFLGVDIEALAARPIDDSENDSYLVPTMENPNCLVCHTVMEPVAGAFQNWGNRNRYHQNFNGQRGSLDALANAYKSSNYARNHENQRWYQNGDTWYRDMFKPGLNNVEMPGGYADFAKQNWEVSDNLVKNGDAENQAESWNVTTGTLSAVSKATCERAVDELRGNAFKLGGCTEELAETVATQEIDVSDNVVAIDSGESSVQFGAYARTLNYRDTPSLWVEFLAADGATLGTSNVLSHKRNWRWENLTDEQVLPEGTRNLRVTIRGQRSSYRYADKYLDAFIDDIYVKLKTPSLQMLEIEGSNDSLQWLGQSLTADPRFVKGTVYFWYRALFKREPLSAPMDPTTSDYAQKLQAFNDQDAVFDILAGRLTQDHGNGAWNVKDLLVDMVATPLFRAGASTEANESEAFGLNRLLTPEELNRKMKSLTGFEWRNFADDRVWRDRMGLFYGGFDGGNLQSNPNSKMNSLMSQIPERMAVEMSCSITHEEFRKGSDARQLFKYVETSDTPAYEDVDQSENNLLINPGAENDMTGWTLETGSVRILSGPRGCQGGPSIKSGEKIFNPGGICSDQTALGRIYQQVDVSTWATEIDQGEVQALYGASLRGWSRNNDEASVYLTFHTADGTELGASEMLIGKEGKWQTNHNYVLFPIQTRNVRFHIQGRRLSSHVNNDSFADDAYLRVLLPGSQSQTLGEERIRANVQFLHKHLLDEDLAVDSEEVTRTYNLFKEVWADDATDGEKTCRLYRDWEDPTRAKRAWSIVLMYLMTDAKFLYE